MPFLPKVTGGDPQLRRLLTQLAQGSVNACKVAELPATGNSDGDRAHATDARKSGEGAAAGTGRPVYWDAASSQWLCFDDVAPTT